MKENLEEELLKTRVLSKNNTFKSAFSATLGFYAAQTLVTFLGFGTFFLVGYIAYRILK